MEYSQRPIPFLVSTAERTFLDDLATRASEAGLRGKTFSPDAAASAHTIIDPLADPAVPICLCGGTGQLLAEVITLGFRLTPIEERPAVAKAANDLMARMIAAAAESPESTGVDQDSKTLRNIYRAGLGLPIISHWLAEDQVSIVVREAEMLASLLDLKIQVGGDGQYGDVASALWYQIEQGEQPTISFQGRSTGGRPAQAGNIRIVDAGTFFATFAISFLVGGVRVVRDGIADATTLRATFIELGKARREALAAN